MTKTNSRNAAPGIKQRVQMRKYENSWAVFVDNSPKWTGLSRSEALWRQDQETWRLTTAKAIATLQDRRQRYPDLDWTCVAQSLALEWDVNEQRLLKTLALTWQE